MTCECSFRLPAIWNDSLVCTADRDGTRTVDSKDELELDWEDV